MLLMQWIAAVFAPERERKGTDRKLVTVAMLFTEAARPKCLYKKGTTSMYE